MLTYKEWNVFLNDIGNWPSNNYIYPNDWGSCQYYTAKLIYDLYFRIKEDLKVEFGDISNFELRVYLMSLFNIKYDASIEIPSFLEVKKKASQFFKDAVDPESTYDVNQIDHILKTVNGIKTVDELFVICRNLSYDLWYAVPTIFSWVLTGITFDAVKKSPGTGPVMNIEAQSFNYKVGLMCAILRDCNLVSSEECFTNFDT